MNQEKIGKFIKELRKEKNMTQQDLASKLNVTDRAVGNWENGRRLPDYLILKDLCDTFGITINELLTGEKITKNDYLEKAEKNLIRLRSQIDKRKKIVNTLYHIFVIIPFIMLIGNMVLNYIYRENWDHTMYIHIARTICMIMIILGFIVKILTFKDDK